jgi:outer membrane protein assembly factor BamB
MLRASSRRWRFAGVSAAAIVAAVACGRIQTSIPPESPTAPSSGERGARGEVLSHDPNEPEDVLARALEMNSDAYAKPPSEFRAGHATPAKLDAGAIQRQKGRFEVRMPSGAPVATPAIYQGRVLVSGGFRSKQFYAFAVETGDPAWGLQLDDDGPSTPACEDEVCLWNTESCTIFAVDAKTGRQLWAWWLGDPLMSAPSIAGGRVFTSYPAQVPDGPPGATHAVIALDLRSGAVLWQKWIDADVMSAPVAIDGFVYAATFAGTIYKLDQKSGDLLAAKARRATSAPVFDERGMYYTRRIDDPTDPKSVEEAVVFEPRRPVGASSSAAAGGSIVLVGGDGVPVVKHRKSAPYLDKSVQQQSQYSLDSKNDDAANGFGAGAPAAANAEAAFGLVGQGSVSSLQAFQGSRVLRLGALSINSMGDEIVSLHDDKAAALWTHKLAGDARKQGGFLAAPPVAAGGRILVGSLGGTLDVLEPSTGKRLRRFEVGHALRSQPVVHAGWIYVGTADGRLVAIDSGDRDLTGWPMWGRDAARSGRPSP